MAKQVEQQAVDALGRPANGVVEILERARKLLRARADAENVPVHDTERLVEALGRLRAQALADAANTEPGSAPDPSEA